MWSEHCSYKNSIKWLKTLPREGDRMLVKAGEENAGLMDIGEDLGVFLKLNRIIILPLLNHSREQQRVLEEFIGIFLQWEQDRLPH